MTPSTGYRLPLGVRGVRSTLRQIRPDIVVLHDPFWAAQRVTAEAHRLCARVVAVHHASAALNAAGIPGPDPVYEALLRRIYHHAYHNVDAVMSVVDPEPDSGRRAEIPLRFGLHPAFRPGPGIRRGHVLYAGRLSLEKGIEDLLYAASISPDPWPIWLVGDGPARPVVKAKAERLGIGSRVSLLSFTADRFELARLYREAACVVQPGAHETFGLVALEAAASGGRVVACSSTPSTRVAPGMIETYDAGDPGDLLDAIDRAKAREPDLGAAAALADSLSWDAVFAAELAEMERLARRRPGAGAAIAA
jgi:alpha-1,6-mannosyltransferase